VAIFVVFVVVLFPILVIVTIVASEVVAIV